MERREEWLDSLKPLDKVLICGTRTTDKYIGEVERVTKTLIIVFNPALGEHRFRKDSGHCRLNTWHSYIIEELTPEKERAIHTDDLKYQVRKNFEKLDWESLSQEDVEALDIAVTRALVNVADREKGGKSNERPN